MTDAELAASYRHGEGLGWIMRSRIGGLITERLVRRQGDLISSPPFGLGCDQHRPGLAVQAEVLAAAPDILMASRLNQ